jgi:hypothetical protein
MVVMGLDNITSAVSKCSVFVMAYPDEHIASQESIDVLLTDMMVEDMCWGKV